MYGMSYKSVKLDVIKEMMIAIIDAETLIGPWVSCAQQAKIYAIRFNTIVKKAKAAAGLYMFIH